MAANANVYSTTTIVSAAPTFNAVVQIATIGPVHVDNYGSIVRLQGMVAITPGADTSAITLELRRNTITGTQIGVDATYDVTVADPTILNVTGVANEPVGNHIYSICITQTDASAAGTVTAVALIGIVGN